MTDYTTRAKKALLQNKKTRSSLLVEDEFANIQASSNLSNIHRISSSKIKLPTKEPNINGLLGNVPRLKRSEADLLYNNNFNGNNISSSSNFSTGQVGHLSQFSNPYYQNNSLSGNNSIINESKFNLVNLVPLTSNEKQKNYSNGNFTNSPIISHNHNQSINTSLLNQENIALKKYQLNRDNSSDHSKSRSNSINNIGHENRNILSQNFQNEIKNNFNLQHSVNTSRYIPIQNIGPKQHKTNKSYDNYKSKIKQTW